MRINIKATNSKLSPESREIIEEKIMGLMKYYSNIIEANVEVGITTFHHQKGNIYRAEANLVVPNATIRAEAEMDDITKSMNEVRDKLKVELVKYKEKNQEQ
ncbi:MAG: ribosome-associated translation inhibitor RaiA [Candidatus Buchananbacteria bacterium]|jgi:ribosomal subunit interface protein